MLDMFRKQKGSRCRWGAVSKGSGETLGLGMVTWQARLYYTGLWRLRRTLCGELTGGS